jgi:hypothetical protein
LTRLILKLPYRNVDGYAKWPSSLLKMLDCKFGKCDALAFADFFEDSVDGQNNSGLQDMTYKNRLTQECPFAGIIFLFVKAGYPTCA